MVCPPDKNKVVRLADEILTDGFVIEIEPLILNAAPTAIMEFGENWEFIPPWGDTMNGKRTLRPFSLSHHKSASRVIALHLIVNIDLEDRARMHLIIR